MTKNRLERVVPYSAPTGVLLPGYLAHGVTPDREGQVRQRGVFEIKSA